MKPSFALVLAASIVAIGGSAIAKPIYNTKYSYYTVGGDSAEQIYSAMLRKGPRVNGAKAYAATSATTTQDGKLMQASSCRIQEYQLRLDFVIKLPKIKNDKVLPPADRVRWKEFSAFLKKHEETHRSIWLGCAADLERQVRSISASSCGDADKKAAAMWEKMRKSCSSKHVAFDAAEQKKLMKHPFVKMVYRRSTQLHAANAP
jgi:predicted secreted Zn-dependent protease